MTAAAPWLDPSRMAARGDRPMRGDELLAEVDFLAQFPTMSADDIAEALGKTTGAVAALARNRGRPDLAERFKPPSAKLARA